MGLTIEIAGLSPKGYLFAPSPLGELTAMLHALSAPAHHPGVDGWVAATSAALEPELAGRLLEADFLWRSSRADFLLPDAPGMTLAEDLDAVDRIDDEAYVATALTTTCGSSRLSYEGSSPLTDRATRRRARELALARGPRQAALADRLLADPAAVRMQVRRLLEDCDAAFFSDAWRRVHDRLTADARRKAELLARYGLAGAVAAVSPALTLDVERHRLLVDTLQDGAAAVASEGITFSPTVFGHPHMLVTHARRPRPVVQYPVREPDAAPVSLDVVQRRLEALAHPARLRLVRTLARGPHTTGELAAAWRLTAPEVSRHLAVLRKAGLLTVRRRGRYVLYELDLAGSARLGTDLLGAVLR